MKLLPLLLLAVTLHAVSAADPASDPWPQPPAQKSPWQADEHALPADLREAIGKMFQAGLADPRGGTYAAFALPEANYFSLDRTLQAHGWIFPDPTRMGKQFAVGWDGLVYLLDAPTSPADLATDLQELRDPARSGSRLTFWPPFKEGLSPREPSLVKIALLARLGYGKEAAQLWKSYQAKLIEWQRPEAEMPSAPFAAMATQWMWLNWNRVLWTQENGWPDQVARLLKAIGDEQEELAALGGPGDYAFLAQADALRAEAQRRMAEPATPADPTEIKDQPERIAALIRNLEQARGLQLFTNEYPNFVEDPTVKLLVAEGEAAVEPLLACLASDNRFIQTVDRGAGGNGHTRIIGVEEPALAALRGIFQVDREFAQLDVPYVDSLPMAHYLGREALVTQIRAYWEKHRGQSPPERWYATLADDHASPAIWADAADNIVRKPKEFAPFGPTIRIFYPSDPPPDETLAGESLRGKTQPSVADLLALRLRSSFNTAPTALSEPFPYAPVNQLARALIRWDGHGQLETLRWYSGELEKLVAREVGENNVSQLDQLLRLILIRVGLGDATALPEYAAWIRTVPAKQLMGVSGLYGAYFFLPVWQYPRDPAMAKLAEQLFADPASPWSVGPQGLDPRWVIRSVCLPLENLPSFRALVLRQLENKDVTGHVEITAQNVMVQFIYGGGDLITDPETPPTGTKMDLRACDLAAVGLAKLRGFPRCEPYWPVERRDRAIAETRAMLEQYGDRVSRTVDPFGPSLLSEPTLTFPRLDHPATLAEVKAGRAIFSLPKKAEVFALPQYPLRAKWTKLEDEPEMRHGSTEDGKELVTKSFDQEVTIWQAERVLHEGQYHYVYGVVAKHHLTQVPGEELTLYGTVDGATEDAWGISLETTGSAASAAQRGQATFKPGEELTVDVIARNLRGAPRVLAAFSQPAGHYSWKDLGLEAVLQRGERPTPPKNLLPFDFGPQWTEAPTAWPATPVELLAPQLALEPLEEKPLLRLHLGPTPTQPGRYQVKLKFDPKSPLHAADQEWMCSVGFEVVP